MTGFKTGASADDPFSGDGDNGGDDDNTSEPSTADEHDHEHESGRASTPDREKSETQTGQPESEVSATSSGLPWIYERDSITDGRTKTVQLHLQEETLGRQRDARSIVERELGESVKKADLREAALLVGLTHLDDVAAVLREWGYDFN